MGAHFLGVPLRGGDGGGAQRRRLSWESLFFQTDGWTRIKGSGMQEPTWLPVVYGCLRLIQKRLSTLPVRVLDPDQNELSVPSWIRRPNNWLSLRSLIEGAVHALLMHGAWTVLPVRDRAGRVQALTIPDPATVALKQPGGGQDIELWVDGKRWTGEFVYAPWMTRPGDVRGVSAVGALRVVSEIGAAAQDYMNRFLKEGMIHQYVITSKDATDETVEELDAVFKAKYSGPEVAFRPMVLTGDMTVTPISMNLRDAEFLSLAKWSDARICAQVFGIDPSIMGIVLRGAQLTYQNQQQREQAIWIDACKPVAVIIEEVLTELLPRNQTADLDERVNLSGSAQDLASMVNEMASMTVAGSAVFTVNELRELMGYQPREDLPQAPAIPPPPASGVPPDPDTGDDD